MKFHQDFTVKNRLLRLGVVLVLCIANCKAQDTLPDNNFKNTIDVRAELYLKLEKSKNILNTKYNKLISFLDSIGNKEALTYKKHIASSQSYWKKYCKSECKITEYESRNGAQGGLPFFNICITEMNNQRAKRLSEILNNLKTEFEY